MKKIYSTITLLLSLIACVSGQNLFVSDFSWTPPSSVFLSNSSFTLCEGAPNDVSLTSTLSHHLNDNGFGGPLSNGHPMGSVLIPYPTLDTSLMLSVTLSFTSPVADLQLLIRDLDDDVPSPGPEETFSNFRINGVPTMPNSITPTQGSYATVGNVVNPLAANCNGWFRWAIPNITTLSFDYWRKTKYYAFLLDSLMINCNGTFVGVELAAQTPAFSIAPNPAHAHLDISFEHVAKAEYSVQLYDVAGRQLVSTTVAEPVHRLPTDQLQNGVYILKIQKENQQVTQKFVVQH